MITYVENSENWPQMEEELRDRGVCQSMSSDSTIHQCVFNSPQVQMVNFFDIVLDFILLDSFDDLDSPPSSVLTVVQNRWLSNGFKETVCSSIFCTLLMDYTTSFLPQALSTAVWSVLKAKRRMLKVSLTNEIVYVRLFNFFHSFPTGLLHISMTSQSR
jgi:hypothetical protein